MGVSKYDNEAAHRRLETQYAALDNPTGVAILLSDYHALVSRVHQGDYASVDILTDLQTAISRAGLSELEASVIRLVYVEDLTQTDAGERLGIAQYRVHRLLGTAHVKLARVYEYWSRHGEGYSISNNKEVAG